MCKLAARRLVFFVGAVVGGVGFAAAAPAPPGPDRDAPAVSPVEKVRQGLERVVTLKIDRQSLAAAVAVLRDKARLNIVCDGQTIQQQLGYTPEQSPALVQMDANEVKARSALRTMLSPYGLTFAIIGDAVVITTEDMAAVRQISQHVGVHFDKVELAVALKQMARETAVNLTLDTRVEKEAATKVSLQLDDVPLETAVRLMAEMAGLKPVRVGNAVFVTRKQTAVEMRGDPDLIVTGQGQNVFQDLDNSLVGQVRTAVPAAPLLAIAPIDITGPAPKAQDAPAANDPKAPTDAAPVKKDGDK